jgi:hypothetical protein
MVNYFTAGELSGDDTASSGIKGWKILRPAGTLPREKSFSLQHNAAGGLIHEAKI